MTLRIGITTTVPVEVIFAAGHTPVDLNNCFVGSDNPDTFLDLSQKHGFTPGVCAWIKGIFGAAISGEVDKVVAVVHGDCANTVALGEVFAHKGVPVLEFAFPHHREKKLIGKAIDDFIILLKTDREKVAQWKKRLDKIRQKLITLDDLTWQSGQVTGEENHLFLVSASDFTGDPDNFEHKVDAFLEEALARPEKKDNSLRLGVIGVPTIFDDLYQTLENRECRVVFNEVQRQFAMPAPTMTLTEQYANYTYPFDLTFRLEDITRQIKLRKIDGLIHYIQSFCHRQIEDIVIRENAGIPVLAIEGDRPGPIDGRTKTRIDAFLEMLRGNTT